MEEVLAHLGHRSAGATASGDLCWFSLRGQDALASRQRVWRRNGSPIALGLLDEPTLIRMAIAPEVDADVAEQLVRDFGIMDAGVLPDRVAAVEARSGSALRALMPQQGWVLDDPWIPLRLDLTERTPTTAVGVSGGRWTVPLLERFAPWVPRKWW